VVDGISVLPDELQEVGLNKGEFSETLMEKMSKEPQPPLGGVFGKDHFGHLADIEEPNGRGHCCPWRKPSSKELQFWWRIWPAWYSWLVSFLEDFFCFDNVLIRNNNDALTLRLYLINKISICYVFNMVFTNTWYGFSSIYVNHHFFENDMK